MLKIRIPQWMDELILLIFRKKAKLINQEVLFYPNLVISTSQQFYIKVLSLLLFFVGEALP